MHREWYSLNPGRRRYHQRRQSPGQKDRRRREPTSVRVLESTAVENQIAAREGWTDIFIYPPYPFKIVDRLITNFHLPKTTLLALVCALAGQTLTLQAYHHAIREKYLFYSYGDAMLIL